MHYFKITQLFAVVALGLLLGCKAEPAEESATVSTQEDFQSPPLAGKKPQEFTEFGQKRIDDYYWIRDKTNPEVISYLEAENNYAKEVMKSTEALQEKLFEELKGRIKEDDSTVPVLRNGYYYYSRTEKGKQYSIYCRKKGSLDAPEEVLVDGNKMAEGQSAFLMGGYSISPDNRLMAYATNFTGSYVEYDIRVRDLNTGKDLPDMIKATANFEWANDNKTFFYAVANAALRPYRVYRHTLGKTGADPLIYEEKDDVFNLGIGKSKTNDYLFLYSSSFTSSECRYLPADQPEGNFRVFRPREKDVQYYIDHHQSKYFIYYKDKANPNFKIMEAPLAGFEDKKTWKDVVPHNPQEKVEGFDVFERYLSYQVRRNGLQEIRVLDLKDGATKKVNFPEPVYTASSQGAPEYRSTKLRYRYESLNRPSTIYDYDMSSGKSEKLKEQEIPSGFNADDYAVERLWAPASDGVKVPMAIVYKKGMQRNGKNPTLLYSYGSYGATTDAYFRSTVFSLVDRGFIFAIAQIRGGSDLGEQWYDDGKLLKKKNTFTDFIACAEHLVNEKYTSPDHLAINGGSAGGLLVGAVANMRPDLFRVVVAAVPFVDVINTMLDTTLPLTTQEYEQWGNPNVKEFYDYIRSYSPYDNVEKKNYPNILATGGLNDSQVGFHEPAKWVAKLRAMKTDNNIVLLKTNMESGHGGATGRFDRLRETAFQYAFIMNRLGVKDEKISKIKG